MAIWIPKPGELEQTRRENRDYEEGRLNDRIAELERELERWRHGAQIEGDYVCPDSLRVTKLEAERDRLREELENVIADAEERVAAAYRVAEVDLKGAPWPPDYDDYDPRALWHRVWLAEMATKQAQNIMAKAQRQRDALRAVVKSVEWSQVGNRCPSCGKSHVAGDGYNGTHAEDCALRAALGKS